MSKELKEELTEKQRRFIDYYLETGNATEAATKAGYSKKTAYRTGADNLKKPQIKAYIDTRRSQMDEERIAKPEEVLKYLTSVMRGEVKDQFDLDAPLQERTRAAEALAKRYRLYDAKDKKALSEYEIKQQELELERLKLQNEKLKVEIAKATGQDNEEVADDGFIKALDGKIEGVWDDET